MDPMTTSALITGGVSLANALIGGSAARRQARAQRRNVDLTNKSRMELAKFQFSKDKEMWELMKEYNTPSEQMARFKEAGLNPNLIYGMGTPGNVQQYPQYQAPTIDYTGRPDVGAATMSAVGQGAYQGAQQWQGIKMARENIRQAEIETWLADETKFDKSKISQIMVGQADADLTKAARDIALKNLELRINQVKADLWESGVSPNDATYIRVGINALDELGFDVSNIWKSMPEKMRNAIQNK